MSLGDGVTEPKRAAMEAYEGFRSVAHRALPSAMPPWREAGDVQKRAWAVACEPGPYGSRPDADAMRMGYEAACRMACADPDPCGGMTAAQRVEAWEAAACRAAAYAWIEGEVARATGDAFDHAAFVASVDALRVGVVGFPLAMATLGDAPAATPWGLAAAAAVTAALAGASRDEVALSSMRAYADAGGEGLPGGGDAGDRWRWAVGCVFGWAIRLGGRSRVYADIAAERARQVERWGDVTYPLVGKAARRRFGGVSVEVRRLLPHVVEAAGRGEAAASARDFCDREHRAGEGTHASILVEELVEFLEASAASGQHSDEARRELVQVGAVVVAMIETIDRAAPRDPPAASRSQEDLHDGQ